MLYNNRQSASIILSVNMAYPYLHFHFAAAEMNRANHFNGDEIHSARVLSIIRAHVHSTARLFSQSGRQPRVMSCQ